MKIIFATDFHLSYRQYSLLEREKDFYVKFDRLIDEIIKEKPQAFIELGDIFHIPQPKPIAMKVFRDGMEKLKRNGIRCYGIIGNHTTLRLKDYYPVDYLFKENGLEILDNDFITVDGGVVIGGVGYRSPSDNLKEEVDELHGMMEECNPRLKILLLHQGLKKDIPLGYDFDEEELGLHRFDYVFLGHFHKRLLRKEDTGTVYHYVGSLNSCNTVELEEEERTGKGYTVFDTNTCEIIMKTIPTMRHYLQYNVNSDELNDKTVEEMTVSLKKYSSKPLMYLKIMGNTTRNIYEMLEKMQEEALHIKYEKVQQEPTIIDVRLDDRKTTIHELMMEHFEDEKTGKFAYELFKLLKDDKIDEALELSDKELKKDGDGLGHMGNIQDT